MGMSVVLQIFDHKQKFWPDLGIRWKAKGSPEFLQHIVNVSTKIESENFDQWWHYKKVRGSPKLLYGFLQTQWRTNWPMEHTSWDWYTMYYVDVDNQVSIQNLTLISRKSVKEKWLNPRFHPLLLYTYEKFGEKLWEKFGASRKTVMALIVQSGAIKLLQKDSAQVVIKRAPVKWWGKLDGNMTFYNCFMYSFGKVTVSSTRHTDLMFLSAAIFHLSSGAEDSVMFNSHASCMSWLI